MMTIFGDDGWTKGLKHAAEGRKERCNGVWVNERKDRCMNGWAVVCMDGRTQYSMHPAGGRERTLDRVHRRVRASHAVGRSHKRGAQRSCLGIRLCQPRRS
eukprot:17537-Chlamydomonas_euryale.AAC.1